MVVFTTDKFVVTESYDSLWARRNRKDLSGKDRDTLLRSLSFALNRVLGQPVESGATDDRKVEQRAKYMLRWLSLEGLTKLGEPFPSSKAAVYQPRTLQESLKATQIILTKVDIFALTGYLDGLPLAIILARAFIRETGTSITEYLKFYRET
ncbi:hypothetical protein N7517_010680 [Penicillium concentricum]|uniref:Uncharacterized protein n=1 Tax=Penicillium concentricum TaxID=293559 RepID=A0A9W9R9J4_9EURO|nr:uncharacterized protein N7517_010680 [Penicillium concentricum]KAJ5356071.1 hypothetical protein N7517_010680 [Penicillium concentricum]